ncbi:MAG: MMPL family transporter [Bacteroidetes bacterium]|nr:MMPL family transporter [Bacteroidota bacterium]MBU1717717.1 MMPL family transporter [Bacteroidota bacterium]
MWNFLVRIILRYRLFVLLFIALSTVFMAYMGSKVKLSYELTRMLPESDSAFIEYQTFRERFGEDGNVIVVGIRNEKLFELAQYQRWYDIVNEIREMDGIEEVVSITRALRLVKNTETKKFDFANIAEQRPVSQSEVDSLRYVLESLPFYEGFLYNKTTHAYLAAITLDKKKLNDKSRDQLIYNIKDKLNAFGSQYGIQVHYSGLPYIRTVTTQMVSRELQIFIILALLICALILLAFFRSGQAVFFPMIVVGLCVVWVMGTIAILGYKITILTGILPPLMVVIGIENCIHILNKYHSEYKAHGNKVKALSRVISRIGNATLITNATTAVGFLTFAFTPTRVLQEFGIIASLNIFIMFVLSILLIPSVYSYLPPPTHRHTKHIDNKYLKSVIRFVVDLVSNRRRIVYLALAVIMAFGLYGMSQIKTSGKVVDDIKPSNQLYKDLKFFEENFKGVMPFEISIDTKKKNGVMRLSTVQKIEELQNEILKIPLFSKPLSVAELIKFATQAFYNGKPERYTLPNNQEKNFVLSYFPTKIKNKDNVMKSFMDSTKQYTRVSFQMADVGTNEMQKVLEFVRPKIDTIFNPADFNVVITGNSVIHAKGTAFLIRNLFMSLAIAVVLISLLMALLCSSTTMVLIALLPNLIPQIITAALMGYLGIPIKPSTIIIFSIALGITVNGAIHLIARYRHEMKVTGWNIKASVVTALEETGISIVYSAIVLFFGFAIFMGSSFGGTQALGLLVATTLFFALFGNLIILPTLLMSLDMRIMKKILRDPLIEIYDEEDDINLAELEIANKTQTE